MRLFDAFYDISKLDRKLFWPLRGVTDGKWRYHLILRSHFWVSGLLTCFPFLLVQKFHYFLYGLKVSFEGKFIGILETVDPLMSPQISETTKRHILALQRAAWAIMRVCAMLGTRLRGNVESDKSHSRFISRIRGIHLSNRLQWNSAHLLRSPT